MAFTKVTADPANISKLSNRPNQNDGLSAAQLKGQFDKAGVDLTAYLNDVLTEELERTTDGGSGADSIGATAVGDGTATTVQGVLEELADVIVDVDDTTVKNTGDEAIAGIKNFTDSIYVGSFTIQDNVNTGEIIGGTGEDKLSFSMGDLKFNGDLVWTAGNDGHASGLDADTLDGKQDADMVHKAGNETITDQKTFSVAPVVPTPTVDGNPATKKYTDDLANARYTKTNLHTEGQALVHWGNLTNVPNLADASWKTSVATKTALPVTGNVVGDQRVVLDDGDGKQAVYTCVATTGTYAQQWSKVGDVDWMSEEATRQIQETARQTAEGSDDPKSGRVGAELDRVSAENARVLAEGTADPRTGRIGAELDREDAEDAREAAELLRQAHITDKDNPHEVTAAQVGALSTTDAGDLAELTTTEKGSLVGAINELDTDKVETSAIVNGLTETGTGKVLDARQGRTLSDFIGNQTYTEKNYIADGESATSSIDKLDIQLKKTGDLVSTNSSKISTINFNIGAYLDDFIPLGASWDKGEVPTLTRTDFAVGKVANIGIDSQVVQNDFDSASIYREIIEIEDTLGNKFVRIPKFYIRKVDINGFKSWQICKYKHPGFYLPWCFWDFANSRELPYIDVGKYNASLNGTKLASVANTYPLISKSIVEFRGYAQANNAGGLLGYQQLDVHVIDVLRTLFFIEFGTLNSQAIMKGYTEGQYAATHLATATETGANRIIVANAHADLYRVGQAISVGTTRGGNQIFYDRAITGITVVDESNKAVEFDGDPVDIATGNVLYNTCWKSGFSSNIVASSGCIVANDGKYPCSYRGIENPFGGVFQFIDGVNITDNQAWVCKDAGQYASNVFASPYEKLSYVNINATGYGPVEMGYDTDLPFAEFATSVTGGSTSKHYCDYYYQASGSRIASFGGTWNSVLYAGLSCWYLYNGSSDTALNLVGRLLKKPL